MALLFAALMWGCTADLDKVNDRLDDLEKRVEILEDLCEQMNTNIASLQTIINALQNNDYVTSVSPIVQGGDTIGYVITFSKSGPVTIYNGEDGLDGADGEDGTDGQDGYAPQIGVRQDVDGVYYWTLDGEWLLDDNGEKIPVQGRDGSDGEDGNDGVDGEDGKDGVTPQLKIEDDYWWVSYDGGLNWTKLGKAVGEDGKDGQDGEDGKDGSSIFKDVYEVGDYVYFVLVSGDTIVIPKVQEFDIVFSGLSGSVICFPEETVRIPYTVVGADRCTEVRCYADDGLKAVVEALDTGSGYIEVTNSGTENSGLVLVLAYNGAGNVAEKALVIQNGILSPAISAIVVGGDATVVNVEMSVNTDDYEVKISENDLDWISFFNGTKAEPWTDTLRFAVQEHISGNPRYAAIDIMHGIRSYASVVVCQYSKDQSGEFPDVDFDAVDFNRAFFRRSLAPVMTASWSSFDLSIKEALNNAVILSDGRIVPFCMYTMSEEELEYRYSDEYLDFFGTNGFPSVCYNYCVDIIGAVPDAENIFVELADEAVERLTANINLAGKAVIENEQIKLTLGVASRESGVYKLNIILLEDYVFADQQGYGPNYRHMHVVRGQLTDVPGDEISLSKNGVEVIERVFDIPENIYSDAFVNLRVVAFLAYEGTFVSQLSYQNIHPNTNTGLIVDNVVSIPVGGSVPYLYE